MNITKELAKVFVKSTDILEDELNKNKNLSYSIDDVKALISEWNEIIEKYKLENHISRID